MNMTKHDGSSCLTQRSVTRWALTRSNLHNHCRPRRNYVTEKIDFFSCAKWNGRLRKFGHRSSGKWRRQTVDGRHSLGCWPCRRVRQRSLTCQCDRTVAVALWSASRRMWPLEISLKNGRKFLSDRLCLTKNCVGTPRTRGNSKLQKL